MQKVQPVIWLTVLVAVIYATFSVLRHWHFGSSGFDLGIFDQAVWHYARLEAPANTVRIIPNLLGDHFHPILILLAPLYWLWSSPYVLLIAQAGLFAVALIPIWLFTNKRLGAGPAYCFALAYALFWGVQNAVSFDFHEIAFAVPLIAWTIYLADIKKWGGYWLAIALLLLVKEDQSLLVMFFGFYLLTQKQVRPGLISAVVGAGWFLLATKVFIPYFAGGGAGYTYWTYNQFGPDLPAALKSIITRPVHALTVLFTPMVKLATGWRLFYPFALLSFASPLLLLTIPLILERFLSDIPYFWIQVFHYSATISPILAMSAADGLWLVSRRWQAEVSRRRLVVGVSILILLLNVRLLPQLPLWRLTDPSYYRSTPQEVAGREALRVIPADASVVAQDGVVPHLSQRAEIYSLREGAPAADYIIVSASLSPWPYASFDEVLSYLDVMKEIGYQEVFSRAGWVVLKAN